MLYKCFEIESMMNRAGTKGVPFLFGLDFELENGFFIENPMQQNEILFEVNGIGNYNNHQILQKEYEVSKESENLFPKECEVDKQSNNILSKESEVNKQNKYIISEESGVFYRGNNYNFEIFPEKYSQYKTRFDVVMDGLTRGNSYLTNLTVKTPIHTTISLKDIFVGSKSPYKLYVPNKFVCFSPECFVKINDGKISTYPMKGTIKADIKDAEQIILNDEKEKAEHSTIVDLLRNDLSKVAENVAVKKFRYIDNIKSNRGNILQVSSEIEGALGNTYLDEIGTIIFKLLPAGSVSGAPKTATLDIIRKAEQQARGYYTGIAGYFDGTSLNSFVLIRFIEQENGKLYFRSGGGITAMSNAEKEYREMLQKVYLPL